MEQTGIQAVSSSAQSGTSDRASIPTSNSVRRGIVRNTSYTLKDLHGDGEQPHDNPEDTNIDVRTVRIKDSGIIHTLLHKTCHPVVTNLGLTATLFYNSHTRSINPYVNTPEIACQDVHFGAYVSDMAVFEFIQMIDEIIVPWKKGTGTTHKCLDAAPAPGIMEIMLSRPENLQIAELRRHESIWEFQHKWNIEVVLQENNVFRRYKRLVVFDMDSTLIQQEVIDEIARYVGVEDQVSVSISRLSDEMDDRDLG